MKVRLVAVSAAALVAVLVAPPARAAGVVGQPAPDFTLSDTGGARHSLGAYKG